MGATKKYFYNESQLQFSDVCRALGHPARITIIEHLSHNNHLNCKDLCKIIKLSQSNVSRHCQILHECGIIGFELQANNCFFRLNPSRIDGLTAYIDSFNKIPITLTDQVYYPAKFAH
jgi:ArsR family transcriptional regulator, arsenate/arsenite/antimonite-responsive transcriptional repressor